MMMMMMMCTETATMRRSERELTSTVGPTATSDVQRPTQLICTDQLPPSSSSFTQHRRRRSTGTRQQLMGCVSGQRSPSTPTAAVALLDVANSAACSSRPPVDPHAAVRDRHSPRPSKCYRPTLSVYCDQVVSGNSTLVSAAAAAAAAAADSAIDSGIDVNTSGSFEKDEVDRRGSSAAGRGRSRSGKSPFQFGHSAPLGTRQESGDTSGEQLEPEIVSSSKRDRKSRSQSPSALWRSISSSSLMRSLSRRRAASKSQHGAITAAETHVEPPASRSKLSSVDTDSDCENRDAATDQTRRRRVRGGSSSGSGGSLTGLGLEAGGGGETRRRRSGIFGGGARSFRRTQTNTTTDDDDIAVSQSATLPRRRRCNDGRGSDWQGPSRLSSRASSWASLRRSQTSESLSLMKNQILQLSNGFNLLAASRIFVSDDGNSVTFDDNVGKLTSSHVNCTAFKET